MIIQDLLGALARRLETGALALDSHHLCCLNVNTLEMTLEFVEQQNCLFVYFNVGVVSTAQNDRLLEDVLAANLFHYGTSGAAAFGLDKETNELLLFQRFQVASVDESDFVGACLEMIEVATMWQKNFQHSSAESFTMTRMQAQQRLILNGSGKIR